LAAADAALIGGEQEVSNTFGDASYLCHHDAPAPRSSDRSPARDEDFSCLALQPVEGGMYSFRFDIRMIMIGVLDSTISRPLAGLIANA